jgi:hypothetical protein
MPSASTQVSSRLTLSLGVKYFDGKSSDVLRQTEEFVTGSYAGLVKLREEFAPGSYVELRRCEVPSGWSNDPGRLVLYFTGEVDNMKTELKADYNIPNARPILNDRMYTYLLDGGDGKFYWWNGVSDDVGRIEEPNNLQEILVTLHYKGLSGIKYTLLTDLTE